MLLLKEEGENNMAGMLKTINSCSGTTSKELRDNINKKDITKDQIVSPMGLEPMTPKLKVSYSTN
jgi:hypothetical protein